MITRKSHGAEHCHHCPLHAGTVLERISKQLNKRLLGNPVLHSAARQATSDPLHPTVEFADGII